MNQQVRKQLFPSGFFNFGIVMSMLFFSDCHGSMAALQALDTHVRDLRPKRLILLGDCLDRGKNPPPEGYSPEGAATLLNRWQGIITAVRGNCDGDDYLPLLSFPVLAEKGIIFHGGRKIFFSHGCHWHLDSLPPRHSADIVVYGHIHSPILQKLPDGMIVLNPGALALPRRGSKPSFAYLDQHKIMVKSLWPPTEIIMEMKLEEHKKGEN